MKSNDTKWFEEYRKSDQYKKMIKNPVVYFCAEYAISDFLQTYAGGLGILAGDMVREASDQNFPLTAVGLYYRDGYYHHEIVDGKVVLHNEAHSSPEAVGLTKVVDRTGKQIVVSVPIEDREVHVQAWKLRIGSINIYLLDTEIESNNDSDRHITDSLYVGNRETRLKQEIILGIGGLRLLKQLSINPSIYHLNEGHSAMLALDLAAEQMENGSKDFSEHVHSIKDNIIFTNHTLIPAGNEIFEISLVEKLLKGYAESINVPLNDLISLGQALDGKLFSMTSLAFNIATKVNAVSKIHAKEALKLWPDNPMIPVTNGIHIPSWDCIQSENDIAIEHTYNKEVLLREIESSTGQKWQSNELLIGWARRIVPYKRPLEMFKELERFVQIASNTDRPFRLLMSGQAHESDKESAKQLQELEHLIQNELNGLVVYLPKYRKQLAKLMISGCDIWLNTPKVGLEACGTSGMKAALNGLITLATSDGWVDEVDLEGKGWILENENISTSILDNLENDILPMYYDNKPKWNEYMKSSRRMILEHFSATKMLRNYIEKMYNEKSE